VAVKALVVTYEPSPAELEACLHALSEQVAETVVVDNHSSNIRVILQLAERYGTRVIELDGNYGVDGAANRGIPYVEDANWVLFLDQDSEVRCELSEIIRAAEALGIKAMSLSTAYKANPRGEMFFEKDFAIFSGLIVNGELLRKGLRFDDSIFVDQGDFEFSWKIRSMGYKNNVNN
jgi:rhamnosyltransferase